MGLPSELIVIGTGGVAPMKLTDVTIERFRNFVDPQRIPIEDDVTCLIGKNESGKTTILQALHRLNPANGSDVRFDLVTEYPRWRLARDRRKDDLDQVTPVSARFELSDDDAEALSATLPARPPAGTACNIARSYGNELDLRLVCDLETLLQAAAKDAAVDRDDLTDLLRCDSVPAASERAHELAAQHKNSDHAARAKALTAYPKVLSKYANFDGSDLDQTTRDLLLSRVPKFFYFSTYDLLPGEVDLDELAQKCLAPQPLTAGERTMVALLTRAGEKPSDFLDDDYNSRKAELQASSVDLTRRVFEYWKQNTDLQVVFDTDLVEVDEDDPNAPVYHRLLKVELRDGRHGDVETNFSTRSSGFQWFFSFFAAFSEYQDSPDPIVVLLDEPGTSLHGEAQRDFLRFVFEELGASKQTLYTTHSQYLVDPSRYEKLRAVHDQATRQSPELGVVVGSVDLSADRDTVLPVESALGYSISQHLFLGGGHHLAVEGSSDFVYLLRMTEYLQLKGGCGLDPRLAIIAVGGADNMPAFVALLGRRLKVSALIDGDRTHSKAQRVLAAAKSNDVPESAVVICGEIAEGLPKSADIEDLFSVDDYLRLYNLAFGSTLRPNELPSTSEPILKRLEAVRGKFDHARPAHALTDHRDEFFGNVSVETIERFEALFGKLNATLVEAGEQ